MRRHNAARLLSRVLVGPTSKQPLRCHRSRYRNGRPVGGDVAPAQREHLTLAQPAPARQQHRQPQLVGHLLGELCQLRGVEQTTVRLACFT